MWRTIVIRLGSSPHVRGFVRECGEACRSRRFIPACAGFWKQEPLFNPSGRVHPRMCGVLSGGHHVAGEFRGSSPHVRGFAQAQTQMIRDVGFIPACAGFCIPAASASKILGVHPRMCGVLKAFLGEHRKVEGSSPHVRGFVSKKTRLRHAQRFIPACAGFCAAEEPYTKIMKVHPRMCGVLSSCATSRIRFWGSSPHVRGFGSRRKND